MLENRNNEYKKKLILKKVFGIIQIEIFLQLRVSEIIRMPKRFY